MNLVTLGHFDAKINSFTQAHMDVIEGKQLLQKFVRDPLIFVGIRSPAVISCLHPLLGCRERQKSKENSLMRIA